MNNVCFSYLFGTAETTSFFVMFHGMLLYGGEEMMRKWLLLLLLSMTTMTLIACSDEQATMKKAIHIDDVSEKEYEQLTTVQFSEKPARETLQKVTLSLTIENFDQLHNAVLTVDDNARTLFGKNYCFGSYTLKDNQYEAVFYIQLDKETIKKVLKDMTYTATWEYKNKKKKLSGDFGH